jgi:microcystin-dependent protein
MAITYSLGPMPKWILINNEGTVAGGGTLETFSSLNHTVHKAVYLDAAGTQPYTNPIIFDLNGVQGPFYWQFNDAVPDDLYFLVAKDSAGNLLWTVDDYMPEGTGGGGTVTIYQSLTNYISNSVFIDHIDDTASPTNTTNLVLAPSNHHGFTPDQVNPIIGTNGALGPDIRFVKDNTTATDQITFETFPMATDPMGATDVTPIQFLRYQCTVSPAGETYKAIQFPICQKVKNLSNQVMTFQCWAKTEVTPVVLNVYCRQYFGSGTAASAEVRTNIGTMSLTTAWQEFNIVFTVPSVAAKSLGTPGLQTGDDAMYMQIGLPLGAGALCNISLTKATLHIGEIQPDKDFDNYDQIDSTSQTPRTGDVKTGLRTTAPLGWLLMNDTSIGNVGSGATTAREYTYQLYKTLWDNVADAWAPVSTGRGATATADFLAGKTLTMPRALGRALAGAGSGAGLTARAIGEYVGAETHTLVTTELPNPITTVANNQSTQAGFSFASIGSSGAGGTGTIANPGGGQPHSIMQPTSFMNVFIKL